MDEAKYIYREACGEHAGFTGLKKSNFLTALAGIGRTAWLRLVPSDANVVREYDSKAALFIFRRVASRRIRPRNYVKHGYGCYTPQWKSWSVWEDRSDGDGSSLNNRCGVSKTTQRNHRSNHVIASVAGQTIAKRMNFQPSVTSLQYKRTTTATTANVANSAAAALYATTVSDEEGGGGKDDQLQTSLSKYLSPFTIVFANSVVSSSNNMETTEMQPGLLTALEELGRSLGLPSVLELTAIER